MYPERRAVYFGNSMREFNTVCGLLAYYGIPFDNQAFPRRVDPSLSGLRALRGAGMTYQVLVRDEDYGHACQIIDLR